MGLIMDFTEAFCRRYLIMRGEDPDEIYEGKPLWHDARTDLHCLLLTLDSFGLKDPLDEMTDFKKDNLQLVMDFDRAPIRLAFASQ